MRHPSTVAERLKWAGRLLADEGTYGVVTAVSRASGASRPTVYAWREAARQALSALWTEPVDESTAEPALEEAILTLVLEAHASTRGVQTCLDDLLGWRVSLVQIGAVIHAAEARAVACLERLAPPRPCALAVDELYGNARDAAYLSAVDGHGGAVWGVAGPTAPTAANWTRLLETMRERGLEWSATVHDGGNAAGAACAALAPEQTPGRDVWHVLHRCAVAQARVDRAAAAAWERWLTVSAVEDARAAGRRPKGRVPTITAAAQEAVIVAVERTAADVRYLTGETRRLLAVVVPARDGLLDAATRREELATVLALLAEVGEQAAPDVRPAVLAARAHLAQALDGLLSFAVALDPVQAEAAAALGAAGLGLVGWAWRHRAVLGPELAPLVAGFPPAWGSVAHRLISAWDQATRASSPAETWHSLVRPHLAVHRTLSPGFLALLAVWHNHRVLPRGIHQGRTPLQVCGLPDAPVGWRAALGYAPAPPRLLTRRPPVHEEVQAA